VMLMSPRVVWRVTFMTSSSHAGRDFAGLGR
jgi:hypothetical protein